MASNLSRAANPLRLHPRLELLIGEAMTSGRSGPCVAVVQNGEVALVRAYGFRDVEAA